MFDPIFLQSVNQFTDQQLVQITQNYGFIIKMGIGLIILFGVWIWWIMKKNPDLTFGEIVNKIFLREKLSIFVVALIAINLSEGLWAASITPVGEIAVNPLARFLGHISIQFMAIVCGIYSTVLLGELHAERKAKKKTKNLKYGYALWVFFLFVSLYLPYLNLKIIAGGLKQADLLYYWVMELNPLNWGKMSRYYVSIGLPPNFNPWNAMHYGMQATVGMGVAHVIGVIGDGLLVLYLGKRTVIGGNINAKVNANASAAEEENVKNAASAAKYALKRYGYREQRGLEDKLTRAEQILENLGEADRITLSNSLAKLTKDIQAFDRTNANEDAKKKKNDEFKDKIYKLFQQSTSGGKGFGMTLRNRSK